MKKVLYVFSVILMAAVVVACSKDQKVVKDLEGTWTITAMAVDGVAAPDSTFSGQTFTFETCKVKKEACPGSWTYTDPTKGAVTTAFTYTITEDGTKFNMTLELIPGVSETITSTIDSHSDTEFVYSTTDDGVVTKTTLTKQ